MKKGNKGRKKKRRVTVEIDETLTKKRWYYGMKVITDVGWRGERDKGRRKEVDRSLLSEELLWLIGWMRSYCST
jgi:hypothetical protein